MIRQFLYMGIEFVIEKKNESYLIISISKSIMDQSYETLFQQENNEIYELIKRFVPLLPDFRPLETVERMKKTKENEIEPQDNWRLLHDEIGVMTSVGREKDLEIFDRMLNGPVDDKEKIVTRNKADFPDFFEIYKGLSWLLPYVSSCLLNVDRFYISRGKIDMLPCFRPNPDHLHEVRDKKTFRILYRSLRNEKPLGSVKTIQKLAVSKKSYGAYLLLQQHDRIPFSSFDSIRFLSFSPDLLECMASDIEWHLIRLTDFGPRTNLKTLKKALTKKYIDVSQWNMLNVKKMVPHYIFETILPFLPSVTIECENGKVFCDYFRQSQYYCGYSDLSSSIREKMIFTFTKDLYSLSKDVYETSFCSPYDIIKLLIEKYKKPLNDDFPFIPCLNLYQEKRSKEGVSYIVRALETKETYEGMTISDPSFYLYEKHLDFLHRFIERGGLCSLEKFSSNPRKIWGYDGRF